MEQDFLVKELGVAEKWQCSLCTDSVLSIYMWNPSISEVSLMMISPFKYTCRISHS